MVLKIEALAADAFPVPSSWMSALISFCIASLLLAPEYDMKREAESGITNPEQE